MYDRAGVLAESELSAQDKSLPKLLSVIMVCVSVGLPVRLDPLEVTIAILIELRRRIIRCTVSCLHQNGSPTMVPGSYTLAVHERC